MILNLNENYRLRSIPLNIVLEKKHIRKSGKESWKTEGYYPDLEQALTGMLNRRIEESDAGSVKEVVNEIKNAVHIATQQIGGMGRRSKDDTTRTWVSTAPLRAGNDSGGGGI